jgi:ubiquinone/menaquinone biosynthesis C-methylase UbiE
MCRCRSKAKADRASASSIRTDSSPVAASLTLWVISHASSDYWDKYFRAKREQGADLDWGGCWTEPFIPWLRDSAARRILELGCGTGNDAARLARAGLEVTATDYSSEAITRAEERFADCRIDFQVVDMTERLSFGDKQYDAVMSNVAAHMFSDEVTRRLLAEVKRVLRYGGLLLLHVNSDADRELRAPGRPVKLELEPNYVLEESGQTVRFFSQDYLRSVLADWSVQEMAHVEIPNSATGRPLKRVWRIVASSESPRNQRTTN